MLDWKPVERCSLWAVEKEESRICRVLISVSFFVQLFFGAYETNFVGMFAHFGYQRKPSFLPEF